MQDALTLLSTAIRNHDRDAAMEAANLLDVRTDEVEGSRRRDVEDAYDMAIDAARASSPELLVDAASGAWHVAQGFRYGRLDDGGYGWKDSTGEGRDVPSADF